MNKQELLFKNLKRIKDNWCDYTIEDLDPKSDLSLCSIAKEYRVLHGLIKKEEEINAFRKVINEMAEGIIQSILVMIDGGDVLADEFTVDLIVEETKESLKQNIALHEEFASYLIDVEE